MAKIIKKSDHLEQQIRAVEQNELNNRRRFLKRFGLFAVAIVVFYIIAMFFVKEMETKTVLTVFSLFTIAVSVPIFSVLSKSTERNPLQDEENINILESGIAGERVASGVLSRLPENYIVFQNISVKYKKQKCEIDNLILCQNGLFVVEIKNHCGKVTGNCNERMWKQEKLEKGGKPCVKEFYSPVKQVNTHIYCLSHYLRENGIYVRIEGAVFFANVNCKVNITGEEYGFPVFSKYHSQDGALLKFITSGKQKLSQEKIKKIYDLIKAL